MRRKVFVLEIIGIPEDRKERIESIHEIEQGMQGISLLSRFNSILITTEKTILKSIFFRSRGKPALTNSKEDKPLPIETQEKISF
jgi:hypothetical protein